MPDLNPVERPYVARGSRSYELEQEDRRKQEAEGRALQDFMVRKKYEDDIRVQTEQRQGQDTGDAAKLFLQGNPALASKINPGWVSEPKQPMEGGIPWQEGFQEVSIPDVKGKGAGAFGTLLGRRLGEVSQQDVLGKRLDVMSIENRLREEAHNTRQAELEAGRDARTTQQIQGMGDRLAEQLGFKRVEGALNRGTTERGQDLGYQARMARTQVAAQNGSKMADAMLAKGNTEAAATILMKAQEAIRDHKIAVESMGADPNILNDPRKRATFEAMKEQLAEMEETRDIAMNIYKQRIGQAQPTLQKYTPPPSPSSTPDPSKQPKAGKVEVWERGPDGKPRRRP